MISIYQCQTNPIQMLHFYSHINFISIKWKCECVGWNCTENLLKGGKKKFYSFEDNPYHIQPGFFRNLFTISTVCFLEKNVFSEFNLFCSLSWGVLNLFRFLNEIFGTRIIWWIEVNEWKILQVSEPWKRILFLLTLWYLESIFIRTPS